MSATTTAAMPHITQLGPDCIEANPDISGIGVRVAIYVQNLIAPILAVVAFWDRKVDWEELGFIEAQSMSILLTALALLSSAVVQAVTMGMSTYHALIILNLAWMNNTNTFVYAIMYRYQGVKPLHYHLNRLMTLPPRQKAIPFLFGSLHLSFVAGFGLWFWGTVGKFGAAAQCVSPLPISLSVLGHHILMTSEPLRRVSLAIYAVTAAPGLNVLIITGIIYGSIDILLRLLPSRAFFAPGYFWVAVLIGINVIFIVDTESMVSKTRAFVKPGESQWTFGQTLALFLLILPLRDIVFSFRKERSQDSREKLSGLRNLFRFGLRC